MAKTTSSNNRNKKLIRSKRKVNLTYPLKNESVSLDVTEKNFQVAYNIINKTPDSLHNILDDIFTFVFQIQKSNVIIPDFDNSIIQLKEKITLNFYEEIRQDVLNSYNIYWEAKTMVEKYIKSNFAYSELQLYALLETIRETFQNHPTNIRLDVQAPVQSLTVIKDISTAIIPIDKISSPDYKIVAIALVLFFFEYCDFGKKHPDDPITLFSKFNRDNDFTK